MNLSQFRNISFLLIACCCACKKYVEVPPPADQILSDQVFTSDSKAVSAVTAIYGNMINGSASFANYLTTLCGGLSSDEISRYNPSLTFQEFMNNELTPANAQVKNIWGSAYKSIYYANAVLQGLQNSTDVTAATKTQLAGECKLIRAFCYFYLVNFFGDVPLTMTTDYAANTVVSRTGANEIYKLILSDLSEARASLSDTYTGGDKGRPNRWAATALLARAYLYRQDWTNAEAMSTEILNNGLFTPLQSPQAVFLKNSKEAIWQLAPTNGALQETRQMRPAGTSPQVYLNTGLINGIEPGDLRRQKWVDSITLQSVKYYYPGKYKNTSTAVTEYYTLLRAGEQYLIRAEARANLNNLAGALSDINAVRTRAGLNSLSVALNQAQALSAIEQERRIELFAEWAHRWLDLKRTGRATALLGPLKAAWQPTDVLYPVPQDEILLNTNLTQNPGY